MTKDELLHILKLLSALEGVIFANKCTVPDHLWDTMVTAVETLEREIKK